MHFFFNKTRLINELYEINELYRICHYKQFLFLLFDSILFNFILFDDNYLTIFYLFHTIDANFFQDIDCN